MARTMRTRRRYNTLRFPRAFVGSLGTARTGETTWTDLDPLKDRQHDSGRAEVCIDESRHDGEWDLRALWGSTPRSREDRGGAFDKTDVRVSNVDGAMLYRRTGSSIMGITEWFFRGPVFPSTEFQFAAQQLAERRDVTRPPEFVDYTPEALKAMGADAISRTLPTDPGVSVATSVGELREGLPSLVGATILRKPSVKSAGGEWLNLQFGIKPLLQDARNFADAIKEADKTVSQWYRDSGRKVRRRYSFPDEEKVVKTTVQKPIGLPQVPSSLHQAGTLTTTYKLSRRVWFSGAYTYHAPEYEGWQKVVADADRAYGVIPDLETAWNLTAWTWMIDWFTNAGSVVSNLNAFAADRLVLLYGYLMCHEKWTVEYTWKGKVYEANNLVDRTYTGSIVFERKRRVRANPFGIGFTGGSLNSYQMGILAALGVSRHRG